MKRHRFLLLFIFAVLFLLGCQFTNMFASAPEDQEVEEMAEVEEDELEPVAVAVPTESTPSPTAIVNLLATTPTRQASSAKPTASKTTPTRPAVGPTVPALAGKVPTVSATLAPIKAGNSFVRPPAPCRYANAKITFPSGDRAVSGDIQVLGSANRPDLKSWKIEYRPASTSLFTELNKSAQAVKDATLARLSTKNLPNGTYWLRLSVLGREHVFVAPCQVRFKIAN
jgi:flagellar basal body-associated protein FliL